MTSGFDVDVTRRELMKIKLEAEKVMMMTTITTTTIMIVMTWRRTPPNGAAIESAGLEPAVGSATLRPDADTYSRTPSSDRNSCTAEMASCARRSRSRAGSAWIDWLTNALTAGSDPETNRPAISCQTVANVGISSHNGPCLTALAASRGPPSELYRRT